MRLRLTAIIVCQTLRNELKQKNPGMRNAELLSTISKLWAEMPPEQKDVSALWGRPRA